MKRITTFILSLLIITVGASAGVVHDGTPSRITHTWQNAPLSEVLRTINNESKDYHIHCIYDQLDSIRIHAKVINMTIPEAIAKVTKGQPVKVKVKEQDIFIQYKKRLENRKMLLSGKVLDRLTHSQLIGATVVLMDRDSNVISRSIAHVTRQEGERKWENAIYNLEVPKVDEQYILSVSYLGYETTYMDYSLRNIRKSEISRELPPIYMKQESHMLKGVEVVASKVMFYHRGDTVVYNADAFQLAEGSMLDALIKQLPGAELKNGQIFLNGRFVENLLLNGKDFFRGNQELMLDNLPSYTVKEIKTYEKYGDKSKFLGQKLEDDKSYVMDVQLKKEYRIGGFANVEVGGGTEDRYLARLFALRYSDHSRIALYANMNNLNDKRKPGENDDWKPTDMKSGRQTEKQVGLDFNVEERDERWKADGNVQLSYTDLDCQTTTDRTNFLQTGDSHDHQQDNLRNKTWKLTTDDKFYVDLGGFDLELNPVVKYQNYDLRNDYQSQTYAWNDTLLSQQLTQGKTKGHELDMTLNGRSNIKLTQDQHFELNTEINYDSKDDDRFRRYDYHYGNNSRQRDHGDQMFKNHPSYRASFYGEFSYWKQLKTNLAGVLEYSYLRENCHKERAHYQLDLLDSIGSNPFGITPTDIEFAQIFDAQNSYSYRSHDDKHSLRPHIYWFPKIAGSGASIGLFTRGTAHRQQIHYVRGTLDTCFVRRTTYFESPYNYFQWTSTDKKYRVWFQYNLEVKVPELTNLVMIRDATDPMNIYLGNSDLKNAANHFICTLVSKTDREKQTSQSFYFRWDYLQNQLTQGYIYNPETGVRTWRPYNVNGNWTISSYYSLTLPLDKRRRLMLTTTTSPDYRHYVNMIGTSTLETALPERYGTRNLSIAETLKLACKLGDHRLTLNGNAIIRNVSSPQEGFDNFTAKDYTYGASALIKLPLKMELSTDFTAYTRTGYTADEMNGTDLVWNARLTCPLMKGQLFLALDGFDILGQLSNVTRTINAQSRTESFTNTLPRYALFHAIWRLNKKPNKRQDP
ncbi:MAG: hypothetical protein IK075_04540 [Prevotella sp.]|nr:hypothetical protein [Prevotella sp.]